MTVLVGDCREVMQTMADNSVDAIVTDPPYELGFMGKSWDSTGVAYDVTVWQECLRVLKPGGHLLAFGGSRTYHRLAVAIEDAGFQIRDQIMWVYGSGFPKSLNVGKQDNCENWKGWGTALKPAHEPIVMARKPLDGTVANNVLTHGVGGINIDGCRVGEGTGETKTVQYPDIRGNNYNNASGTVEYTVTSQGRFPANFIHDGSDEVLELFPESNGGASPKKSNVPTGRHYEGGWGVVNNASRTEMGDGSAARFFYCAKASKKDRNEGLDPELFPLQNYTDANKMGGAGDTMLTGSGNPRDGRKHNHHPTVKPTDLMRYLCRLVTPPNGTVLDPFLGSGSTGKAATLEGFNFIGIEQSAEYAEIANARINHAKENK
jgi:site-specific DNA-methyltransferase (adenine-specific)